MRNRSLFYLFLVTSLFAVGCGSKKRSKVDAAPPAPEVVKDYTLYSEESDFVDKDLTDAKAVKSIVGKSNWIKADFKTLEFEKSQVSTKIVIQAQGDKQQEEWDDAFQRNEAINRKVEILSGGDIAEGKNLESLEYVSVQDPGNRMFLNTELYFSSDLSVGGEICVNLESVMLLKWGELSGFLTNESCLRITKDNGLDAFGKGLRPKMLFDFDTEPEVLIGKNYLKEFAGVQYSFQFVRDDLLRVSRRKGETYLPKLYYISIRNIERFELKADKDFEDLLIKGEFYSKFKAEDLKPIFDSSKGIEKVEFIFPSFDEIKKLQDQHRAYLDSEYGFTGQTSVTDYSVLKAMATKAVGCVSAAISEAPIGHPLKQVKGRLKLDIGGIPTTSSNAVIAQRGGQEFTIKNLYSCNPKNLVQRTNTFMNGI